MSANSIAPGAQQKRFAAYLDRLAHAAGHLDRVAPLKSYCTGLLLPGGRKSVEPMAARLCPDNVRQTHQSLHHIVAHAPWNDDDVLEAVRRYVVPAMQEQGPLVAWIVDDTGLLKKGTHSVGVARQYCGQVGKQENCRVAVSLSLSTMKASLPIGWRLYLPEPWTRDKARRKTTGVPAEIGFQTKPEIALQQIRAAVERQIPSAPVLSTGRRHGSSSVPSALPPGCDNAASGAGRESRWKPLGQELHRRQSAILLASIRSFFRLAASIARSISGCATFTFSAWGTR